MQIEQIAEAGNEDQGVPGDAAHDSGWIPGLNTKYKYIDVSK